MRLVSVFRGGVLESFHSGSISVVDSTGRLLAYAGDPTLATFLRSSAKPFQAIPLLRRGGLEEYELTPPELALICASHGGEPHHVSTAAAILRKGEYDESDLQCGAHKPYDERSAAELRQSGEAPSALHNNCSGKHAGMLLGCQLMDAPSGSYLEPDHPLQLEIRRTVADFCGLEADEIPVGVDGCGVPAFHMSLYRAALAYARFSASAFGAAGSLPMYSAHASHVFKAMTAHADYVAGSWSITTPLIEGFDGELIGKDGGEAFYAMALSPRLSSELDDRLERSDGAAVGIAIKIHDGGMGRAREPIILRTLELLGLAVPEPLLERRSRPVTNVVGKVVGEVVADFELQYL
jgi:L-asparaginase II